MKPMRWFLTIPLVLILAAGATAGPQDRLSIRPGPRADFEIFVWPDRGVDAVYHPGDRIKVYFEVTRDCYVVLYDIDTHGRLHILFPFSPWQDNYVRAGHVYELPGDWDTFSLHVEGPSGTEYIQAIASPYPIDLPDWPIYLDSPGQYPVTCPDPVLRDFRAGDDRLRYISRVNRRLIGDRWDWCATDLARFYVQRKIYRPHPPVIHPRPIIIDPWPDIFIEVVYIGWPIGGRIYIDGVYYGVAPLRIRGLRHGRHRIECYHKGRLVRTQRVEYRHKRHWRERVAIGDMFDRHRSDVFRKVPHTRIERVKPHRIERDKRPAKRPATDLHRGSRSPGGRGESRVERKSRVTIREKEVTTDREYRENTVKKRSMTTTRKPKRGVSKFIEDAGREIMKSVETSRSKSKREKTTVKRTSPRKDQPQSENKASTEKKRRNRRR